MHQQFIGPLPDDWSERLEAAGVSSASLTVLFDDRVLLTFETIDDVVEGRLLIVGGCVCGDDFILVSSAVIRSGHFAQMARPPVVHELVWLEARRRADLDRAVDALEG